MSYAQVSGSDANLIAGEHHELHYYPMTDHPEDRAVSPLSRSSHSIRKFQNKAPATYSPHMVVEPKSLENSYGRWWAEICAYFVALLALAAIAITLGTHKGRPLPDWPFGISVNALVSVFSVILKGMMMIPVAEAVSQLKWSWYKEARPLYDIETFDHASRGLWGSLRFISILNVRTIGSLGAAITILAVASDPFIQQMIKYEACPQPMMNELASIERTNNYTTSGIHTGAMQETLDLPMQAALYQGAFDSFSNITASCGTGNCTFDIYRTVGMCNSCRDISATVKQTCIESEGVVGGKVCNQTLPSNITLTGLSPNVTMMGTGRDGSDDGGYNLTSVHSAQVLSYAYNSTNLNPEDPEKWKTLAVECSLSPCVRTYNVSVIQGFTTETLLSETIMKKSSEEPYGYFGGSPMPCLINGTEYPATAFTQQNETNYIPVWGLLPNNQTAYLPKECYFVYGNPLGLQQFLPNFLTGFYAFAPEAEYSDPAWLGRLYNNGNMTIDIVADAWKSMAGAMTANIRKNGDPSNSKPAEGKSMKTETCIVVKWSWMAFPAALLLLILVFLLATIVQSAARSKGRIWKGSPLALIFHGLDNGGMVGEQHRVERVDEMEDVAKRVKVRMQDDGPGTRPKLVEVGL